MNNMIFLHALFSVLAAVGTMPSLLAMPSSPTASVNTTKSASDQSIIGEPSKNINQTSVESVRQKFVQVVLLPPPNADMKTRLHWREEDSAAWRKACGDKTITPSLMDPSRWRIGEFLVTAEHDLEKAAKCMELANTWFPKATVSSQTKDTTKQSDQKKTDSVSKNGNQSQSYLNAQVIIHDKRVLLPVCEWIAKQPPRVRWQLVLIHLGLTDTDMKEAINTLKPNFASLSGLMAPRNQLTEKGAAFLVPFLAGATHLEMVLLSGNPINDAGLLKLLPNLLQAEAVELMETQVTDAGVQKLAESLVSAGKKSRLEYLALSGNPITDKGAKVLADALKQHPIRSLLLIGTQIQSKEVFQNVSTKVRWESEKMDMMELD